jgi:hypothetical protein
MKAAYLVTESVEAANLLKQVLPKDLLQATEVVAAGRKYAAASLAGTIMSERSRPVLLVVDADSTNLAQAKEREQMLEGMLLPAASAAPYQVCVAVPTVAALAENWPDRLNAEQVQALQHHPLIQQMTQFLASAFSSAA